ncbi:MAG TPA: hypothetical protein VL307_10335 [Chitinophagaceae bacterium]|nr:hypothetical protein [Chitinophagaceae bacterium]
MNLNFTITLSLVQLLLFAAFLLTACFSFRLRQAQKAAKRIAELENEMLNCHREILELYHLKQNSQSAPVIERREGKVLALKHG